MSKAYFCYDITICDLDNSNLDTQKIFNLPNSVVILLQTTDTILIIASNNNIVNINHQIDALIESRMSTKHRIISFTISHVERLNNCVKTYKTRLVETV